MARKILFILTLSLWFLVSSGQNNSTYLKENAVRVDDPVHLSDSVYSQLSPFQIFMMGEMHGTNEPAQFVTGLTKLLTSKGDSVSVGLEIPSEQMTAFNSSHTDSSIYQSNFFNNFSYQDGRESFAWARVISHLKSNPKVQLFFFDVNDGEEKKYDRDSMMYLKIKKQIQLHPSWKMVTISGNAHTMTSNEDKKMAWYLRRDKELNLSAKVCAMYNYYMEGSCRANFSHGLELRTLSRPAGDWDTTFAFDKYTILLSPRTTLPYTAVYYTKNITASEMVKDHMDLHEIRKQLISIHERDQKTRAHGDSAQFMGYIDSCNLAQVESLISKYGWMGKSLIGAYCNYTLWLVIQHAELSKQEKYLPMLEASVADSESRGCDLAYLQDRVLMRQGKKQIYGSQVVPNKKTGAQEFYPIEDEKNVNVRRQRVGLSSMEEYATNFGIDYKLPKQ